MKEGRLKSWAEDNQKRYDALNYNGKKYMAFLMRGSESLGRRSYLEKESSMLYLAEGKYK